METCTLCTSVPAVWRVTDDTGTGAYFCQRCRVLGLYVEGVDS